MATPKKAAASRVKTPRASPTKKKPPANSSNTPTIRRTEKPKTAKTAHSTSKPKRAKTAVVASSSPAPSTHADTAPRGLQNKQRPQAPIQRTRRPNRSEERRVGKEWETR